MRVRYIVEMDDNADSLLVLGDADASACILNALMVVDDDHWRDKEDLITVERVRE